MEDYIVLADEMDQACVLILPPLLPAFRKEFLGVGYVADRSVEPDIKHLAFGTFHGDGNTPVEVTADSPGLQASVQPGLALSIDVRPPLLVVLEDPFTKPWLVLVQWKIPMGCLFLYGLGAAKL